MIKRENTLYWSFVSKILGGLIRDETQLRSYHNLLFLDVNTFRFKGVNTYLVLRDVSIM